MSGRGHEVVVMTTTHGGDGWCPRGRYWLISGTAGGVVTTTKRVTGTDAQNQDITPIRVPRKVVSRKFHL